MRRVRPVATAVVVAAALVAAVLAVYVGVLSGTSVLLTGTLSLGRPGVGPVVLATLVVALVVQPAYLRLRRWTRRAFGVVATDPFDLLRSLPRSVTAELPAEDIPRHMARVLAEGLRSSRCELWLRVAGGYRVAACWPEVEPGPAPPPGGPGREPAAGERWEPVVHGGETIGLFLVCHEPPRDLSSLERRLLDAYASQSGQVVRMLALRAALQERQTDLDDRSRALREANAQLVEARALERRRLERDLHDGGQQQLLVLALGVELARQQATRSGDTARATLERAQQSADQARAGLVELVDGLTPRILATHGLVAALRSAVSDLVVPVSVRARGDDVDVEVETGGPLLPMPAKVAEALFYVGMEATQNATKHAGAPHVAVEVGSAPGSWWVVVTDGGLGFDPGSGSGGSGLLGMRDRLDAVGGRLDVTSSPGSGTRVAASVPWPAVTVDTVATGRGGG